MYAYTHSCMCIHTHRHTCADTQIWCRYNTEWVLLWKSPQSLHIKGLLPQKTCLVNDTQLKLSYLFGSMSQAQDIALYQIGRISELLSSSGIFAMRVQSLFMRTLVSVKSCNSVMFLKLKFLFGNETNTHSCKRCIQSFFLLRYYWQKHSISFRYTT